MRVITYTLTQSSIFWYITPFSLLKVNRLFTLVSSLPYSSTQKMEAICSSDTSVGFQRTTQRYIPKDRILHDYRCENLEPTYSFIVYLMTLLVTKIISSNDRMINEC
jgi:hypothetical protein